MNAGLGSLKLLKAQLLASTLVNQTTYDAEIALLGQGVAAGFERATNRLFVRTAGATAEFPGDQSVLVLPRYPIETVTSIEFRASPADPYVVQDASGVLQSRDDAAGIVETWGPLGSWRGSIRVTWTGGWWWDTTEDDTGVQPVGSTALPADVRLAWVLQCRHVWSRMDALRAGLAMEPDKRSKLGDLELIPEVLATLRQHTRHG